MIENLEKRAFVLAEILKANALTKSFNSNRNGAICALQGRLGIQLAIYGTSTSIIKFNAMTKRDNGYPDAGDMYGFYINGVLQHEGPINPSEAASLLPRMELIHA